MSVHICVNSERQQAEQNGFTDVIGYVLAAVVKGEDGSVTLERAVRTCADSRDDNDLAESVVKTIERKLNEAFPDPNKQEEPKIWVPA